ncbi:MAG TPA: hypothetical protein VKZ63_16540 [Kofleriaceae bacterium]|nr:hypothetical protein [Kofleriaceae bacterium]
MIALAIAALAVIGIAAIWGGPLRAWLDDLGGDAAEPRPAGPRAPAGTRL